MAVAARKTAPTVDRAAPAAVHTSRSGAKVTVACKLPHGLLIRIFDMVGRDYPILGGGMRTVKEAQQTGPMLKINGTAAPFGMQPNCTVVGGYALTPNVDGDFIERWMQENKDLDAVQNDIVFAGEHDTVVARCKEQKAIKSGLEPINPDPAAKDPRMVKGIQTAKLTEDA